MTDDRLISIVYLLAALVLPITALVGRKLQWKKTVLIALIWAAIFVGLTLLITLLEGAASVGGSVGQAIL